MDRRLDDSRNMRIALPQQPDEGIARIDARDPHEGDSVVLVRLHLAGLALQPARQHFHGQQVGRGWNVHAQPDRQGAVSRVFAEREQVGLRIALRRRHLPHGFVDPIGRQSHSSSDLIRNVADEPAMREKDRIDVARRVPDITCKDKAGSTVDRDLDHEPTFGR